MYEDYLRWEGQWEIIDGIPYVMSPAPVSAHQYVAGAVHSEFHFALKKCKHCKAYQLLDYKIEDDTPTQPDMFVVCTPTQKNILIFHRSLLLKFFRLLRLIKTGL